MDILIIAKHDWANLGYSYHKALKAVGVDSVMVKLNRHHFAYPEQGTIRNIKQIISLAQQAKIIQYIHSEYISIGPLKGKRVFVIHGGSKYRQNSNKINKIFNPMVEKTIIQTADLLDLGAKNEVWVLPPIDTITIKPIFNRQSNKIIIGHYPSDAGVKGSDVINKIIKKINNDEQFKNRIQYNYSDKSVNWNENIKRMSTCDIYVEALSLKQNGKKYGEWGITCLEAAALGKIIITHSQNSDRYRKEYGECPLNIANSPEELETTLKNLIMLKDDDILEKKKQIRHWVETLHNYRAIGKRLFKKVYNGKI